MVRVRISKRRHLITLVLTLCFFTIGLLLGFLLTDARVEHLGGINEAQKLEYDSLQLQYLYISTFLEDKNCPAVTKALEENINKLEKARIKLESYIEGEKEDYKILKREYVLSELRYWLLARQTKDVCKKDTVSILYFYTDDENCEDCRLQGNILTELKSKFKDRLLIFSFDSDFEQEPVIPILKKAYNITVSPTMIIENEKYEGFTPKKTLSKTICSHYEEGCG